MLKSFYAIDGSSKRLRAQGLGSNMLERTSFGFSRRCTHTAHDVGVVGRQCLFDLRFDAGRRTPISITQGLAGLEHVSDPLLSPALTHET